MVNWNDWQVPSSGKELTESIGDKTVVGCEVDHDSLTFRFTDGSALHIECEWIYGWELREKKEK